MGEKKVDIPRSFRCPNPTCNNEDRKKIQEFEARNEPPLTYLQHKPLYRRKKRCGLCKTEWN